VRACWDVMIDLGATTSWETSKPLWSEALRAGDGVPAFQVCNAELVCFCNAELVCFGLVLGLGGNDSLCVFVSLFFPTYSVLFPL
jgi:hypothetical protein